MNESRILVVEDEQIVAADLIGHLSRLGYQPVAQATSGAQAIALAGELRPDLVLMDIKLEGDMDGIAAAQEIRQRFHIPAIFLTAFSEQATVERARLAEPYGYVLKPFEGRELRANIEVALYKHRAEEALRQSQAQLQFVTDHAPVGLAHCDHEQRYKFVNQPHAQMYGQQPADLVGQHPRAVIGEEVYRQASPHIEAALAGKPSEFDLVFPNRQTGPRAVHVRYAPERDETGRVIGFVAAVTDITEHQRLEERARQAQKMEATGHLAGGMAHEFNNILAAMMLSLNLVPRQNQEPETLGLLDEIQTLAQRSASLVSQLLAFSRKSVIHRQPLDLAGVVAQQSKLLNRLLGERIQIEIAVANSQTWVEADKGSVEQVLLNLCLNARDAMPQGGVLRLGLASTEVSAETAAAHPQVEAGRFVCLSVADTGGGMSPEIMSRLFEPFFTTKAVGQGTGLGLATVRGLVEQHHGWVEAESRLGSGSTFRVYLPATARPVAVSAASALAASLVRGLGTILVVEDEAALLKVEARLLSHCGYVVLTATDGAEAQAVWKEHAGKIDLLFTDMALPGAWSGLQLAEQFRAEKPGVKVIITSGYNPEVLNPDRDYAAAAIVYLPKPCPPAFLTRVIYDCLQRK